MKVNVRFFKTKVDLDNVYMIMTKCNLCPFLMCDTDKNNAVCGHPKKIKIHEVIKTDILYFEERPKTLIVDDLRINEHCPLSKTLDEEFKREILTYKNEGFIYVFSSPKKDDERPIFESYMQFHHKSDLLTFTDNYNRYTRNKIKYDSKVKERNEFKTPNVIVPYVKNEVCSCCGLSKEDVDRDKNNGMCEICFTKFKLDNDIKYFSYINNFRIKRNMTFNTNKYKKVGVLF